MSTVEGDVRETNLGLSTEAARRMREMGESMAIDSAPEMRPDNVATDAVYTINISISVFSGSP